MTRYVLEGKWGYRSYQRRVVHREVIDAKRADRLRPLHAIVFTDNTSLLINIREAKSRERVETMHQYNDLIRKVEREQPGKSRVLVADLSN